MKIAHRMPIDADHSLALTWKNLIGSCDGGQRSQGRCWTCDAAQGSKPLSVDPTEKGSVGRLAYGRRADASGLFVTSDDEILRTDVDHTLKLNSGDLPALRDAARKAFQEHCRRALATRGRPAWKQAYPAWLTRYGDALPEFLGAIEALL